MKNTIEYIKELENKIKYLEELDRKNFLSILKLQNKIKDYENNYIEFSKYDELHNNYIVLLQAYDNIKNKKEVIK
jgi:hypothetical protein